MMKDLKDILNEGLLSDIETTIKDMDKGAFAKMCPVPSKNDFYYTQVDYKESMCSWGVDWECREYIKSFVEEYPERMGYKFGDICGLVGRVSYYGDKSYCLSIFPYTLFRGTKQIQSRLFALHDFATQPAKGKDMILKVFNHLVKYPDAFKYILDHSSNSRDIDITDVLKIK